MKFRTFLYIMFVILAASCGSGSEILLQVFNPLDQPREDATILLSRGEISNMMEIPDGTVPLLLDENRDPLPCQADDVDGDGQWDELFALIDLSAKGTLKVVLQFVAPGDYPEFEVRTNLRLGDASKPGYPELETASRLEGVSYHNYSGRTEASFQMEGPAWENDRVGFRNYLDQRNGMDIFGKLTREMVLDSVGMEGRPSYHEPAAWGMDVLKVGTSLGAGAIGYMYLDSIYRVGDNGSGTYGVVFEGSQRSRFKLSYTNWKVGEEALDVVHQVEIGGGRHYYQGTVVYSGTEESLNLVTGIVNMKSKELHMVDLDAHHTAFITHDLQSEDTTLLAMALMMPKDYLVEYGETKESGEGITQTYYAVLESSSGEPVAYRFYALWEKEDPRWASLENVTEYLKNEAARWTQSVIIEVLQ
jgi:hypothetical protein